MDHFVHIRSTGDNTTGLWRAPVLKVTTDVVCKSCNGIWLSDFENLAFKPIATPLILDEGGDIITPKEQWTLAAWAYKMALLLEVAAPAEERRQTFTAAERKQFRVTTLANEHVRIFLAKYETGKTPAHAQMRVHTLRRRDDGVSFQLKITTLTAGALAMQAIAVRYVATGELAYAVSELEFALLGRSKTALAQIWPAPTEAVRWPSLEHMSQDDIEDWTNMWETAQGFHPVASVAN